MTKKAISRYPWMSTREALGYEKEARAQGVSAVARSARGFMRAYEKAKSPNAMALVHTPGVNRIVTWDKRRDEFIARHLKQYRQPGGATRRRFLMFAMWAYRPNGPEPLG